MRVLITGAAGFIGNAVALSLTSDSDTELVCVDSINHYLYPASIKESRFLALEDSGVTLIREPLAKALDALEPNFDVIVHCAATPGLAFSWENPSAYLENNLFATQHLLAFMARHSFAPHLVHLSTSSVYGTFATGSESANLRPVSPYGLTKLAAEMAIKNSSPGIVNTANILRLFSVYGPGQRRDMAYFRFIDAMLRGQDLEVRGDGTQIRTNTYIDDVVSAISRALTHRDGVSIFNIGGQKEVTVNEVIIILEEMLGVKAKTRFVAPTPGDQLHTHADTTKANKELGFRNSVSLEEGLTEQVRWQKAGI